MSELDERIAALTRAGLASSQIAIAVGVTRRTVQRARRRAGIAQPFTGIPLTDDERRRAADMLDDGASYAEVARTLGRDKSTISKWFPDRGWPPGRAIEYRRFMEQLDSIGTA